MTLGLWEASSTHQQKLAFWANDGAVVSKATVDCGAKLVGNVKRLDKGFKYHCKKIMKQALQATVLLQNKETNKHYCESCVAYIGSGSQLTLPCFVFRLPACRNVKNVLYDKHKTDLITINYGYLAQT